MKGILPEKVRCRKDKMGFITPQDIWLKEIEDIVKSTFILKNLIIGLILIQKGY